MSGGQAAPDLINVRDVVRANLIASEHPNAAGKIFNVCTECRNPPAGPFGRDVARLILMSHRLNLLLLLECYPLDSGSPTKKRPEIDFRASHSWTVESR